MAHDSRPRSESNVHIELDSNWNATIDEFFLDAMGGQTDDTIFTPTAAQWAELDARVSRLSRLAKEVAR